MRLRAIALVAIAALAAAAGAAEVIPPAPAQYFNDYAGVVDASTSATLNGRLEQFERATSNQILVVVYPQMQSGSSIEDYTVRVAQAWEVGTKAKKNGAVLFVFTKAHQMYLQVGYGLEGAIPDALAKRIISDEIAPLFRAGDYDGGMTRGVDAIIAAARGEYKGTGSTVSERHGDNSMGIAAGVFVLLIIISTIRSRFTVYGGRGRRGFGGYIPTIFPGGFGGGGGGFGGGGGGGFTGGGGSFGGGGAGGSW